MELITGSLPTQSLLTCYHTAMDTSIDSPQTVKSTYSASSQPPLKASNSHSCSADKPPMKDASVSVVRLVRRTATTLCHCIQHEGSFSTPVVVRIDPEHKSSLNPRQNMLRQTRKLAASIEHLPWYRTSLAMAATPPSRVSRTTLWDRYITSAARPIRHTHPLCLCILYHL